MQVHMKQSFASVDCLSNRQIRFALSRVSEASNPVTKYTAPNNRSAAPLEIGTGSCISTCHRGDRLSLFHR
jgi:hypothetical protein